MNKSEAGFVYILSAPSGHCKIGKSRNPEERTRSFGLKKRGMMLVHVIASNDSLWLEARFHDYFSASRIKGEWFDLSADALTSIKKMIRCDRYLETDLSYPFPEAPKEITPSAKAMGSRGGKKGGPARAQSLSPERRKEIARMGGQARWADKGKSWPPPEATT